MRKRYNKDLPFIKDAWEGNPLDENGIYSNLDGLSARGLSDVVRWKFTQKNKYAEQRKNQQTNVDVISNTSFLDRDVEGVTWLGHATFLFCVGGKRILTDPVLGDIWPLKRFTNLPCDIEELTDIDCILLSHNHRDHADKASMKKITSLNPNAVIFTGLGIKSLLQGWNIKNEIIDAGWYQTLPSIGEHITINYLPAKHWNRRFLHDLNQMLWGSFMISINDKNLYFGADSGLGIHFKEIGELFDIDLAILGIGAYEPTWFMNLSHTSPSDALEAMSKLKANHLIPMHYGTFDLSDEPIFNPKNVMKELAAERNDVWINDIGYKFEFTYLAR